MSFQILDVAIGREILSYSESVFTIFIVIYAALLDPVVISIALSVTLTVPGNVPAATPLSVKTRSSAYPSVCTQVGGFDPAD